MIEDLPFFEKANVLFESGANDFGHTHSASLDVGASRDAAKKGIYILTCSEDVVHIYGETEDRTVTTEYTEYSKHH